MNKADYLKRWREKNPKKAIAYQHDANRKGGKYYERQQRYERTGIPGKRNKIRVNHRNHYRPFKQIIAPESQIHHEWIPDTADYRGVALVEADQHMHGFIDVIQILEGEITIFTEAEIRGGDKAFLR